MRELTNHITSGDQAVQLRIVAVDSPGAGGASTAYLLTGMGPFDEHPSWATVLETPDLGPAGVAILFQNGNPAEAGVNGITNEALLAIVEDRLAGFAAGPFSSLETQVALDHVKLALAHLKDRTARRIEQGIEGTLKPDPAPEFPQGAPDALLASDRAQDLPSGLPTILVDFDGVLHSYTSGWEGADVISDPPVPGAIEWLWGIGGPDSGFEVCIYSSRSRQEGGIQAMKDWLREHGLDEDTLGRISFPTQKPAAFLTIDDRAICFEGRFPTLKEIANFKPWNRR